MNHSRSSAESQYLLVHSPQSAHQNARLQCYQIFCIPSKAATLVILWTAIVGSLYYLVLSATQIVVYKNPLTTTSVSVYSSLLFAILALARMFYPLSGFMADVYCGRHKAVMISLCLLLPFTLLVCVVAVLWITLRLTSESNDYTMHFLSKLSHQLILSFVLFPIVLFTIGLVGYHANFIQFGLDQLFEAPSKYLALFIHYAIWAFYLGSLPLKIAASLFWCGKLIRPILRHAIIPTILLGIFSLFVVLLIIGRWKCQWFYTEPSQENPYKTVLQVIQFTRKHKYPVQRSAFTYSNDYIPSRIDFAKERYGSPFTTEQVENVKTFCRILLVLLALGPTFALEVPASFLVFPMFGLHALHNHKHIGKDFKICDTSEYTWETVFVGSGSLLTLVSTVGFFPTYIWITSTLLHKKLKNMFARISMGVMLCLLGIASLFVIDVVGHKLKKSEATMPNNTATVTMCMFQFYTTNTTTRYPSLNMYWSALIPPNVLLL